MRESPVGLPACGGAGSGIPDEKASVVQPFRAGSSDDKTRAEALDYQEKPGEDNLIFDAGKLHSQLAELLKLYLKRASDPDAIEKCSAKDAISCAKTLTGMMSDFQSGKPASVNSWSGDLQVATPSIARPGDLPAYAEGRASGVKNRRLDSRRHPSEGPISTLEDAVSVVCMSDEETQILEPWARLLARISNLCIETQKRLNRVQPPIQVADHKVCRLDSRRHPDSSSVGVYPPGRARHAVPSDEDDDDSVVQPRPGGQAFRAGSSEEKTRAEALDYREKRQKSRDGEPSGTSGVADKPGVLKMDPPVDTLLGCQGLGS